MERQLLELRQQHHAPDAAAVGGQAGNDGHGRCGGGRRAPYVVVFPVSHPSRRVLSTAASPISCRGAGRRSNGWQHPPR